MARPYLLGQLSDLHLGDRPKHGADPTSSLEAVLAALDRLPNRLDAIVVTGDLTDHGRRKEYRLARELLDGTGLPVHVMPGNHDDRAKLREAFALPGDGDAPVDYEVDLGPLALVVVDSTAPGEEEPGRFEPAQLERLDRVLADIGEEKPTIVAMHHSPLPTAMPGWDRANLIPAEDRALEAVIARHPQVKVLIGGHLHRVATATLAGRPVLAGPSTYLQARPDFAAEDVEMYARAPGFALHAFHAGALSSQVEILPAPAPA
ncbi:MAG TPA: metallophosphoesterase [Solirubrobacterales bacterium]|nr:metallophosphoesterase [Solirubrobacterales bacterium]